MGVVDVTKEPRVFPAQIEWLGSMLQWIQQHLLQMSFDEATLRKVELASEEALVNIIRHAYKTHPGRILIHIHQFADRAEIVLIDEGPPFNPLLEERTIDACSSLEERKEGGLGILFMRQYMDEVRYHRNATQNILTLIKRVPA